MIKVASDMDGIWTDFVFGMSLVAKDEGYLNRVYTTGDMCSWQAMDEMLGEEVMKRLWRTIADSKSFWSNLPPTNMRQGGPLLRRLIDDKVIDFHVVTSRVGEVGDVKHQTSDWFRHFVNVDINPDNIHRCKSREKVGVLRELGIGFFIDDHPEIILEMEENNDWLKGYSVMYRYNQYVKTSCPNITWVSTVGDYLDEVSRAI